MATALELLRERRYEELWQRCCGFTDLDIQQYMNIQHSLLLEQINLVAAKRLATGFVDAASALFGVFRLAGATNVVDGRDVAIGHIAAARHGRPGLSP